MNALEHYRHFISIFQNDKTDKFVMFDFVYLLKGKHVIINFNNANRHTFLKPKVTLNAGEE